MNPSIVTYSYKYSPHTYRRFICRGGNIMVGTVMKANIGELEDEVRRLFSRSLRKQLKYVVQVVSGKMRLLVRFKYGCDKYPPLNQINSVTVDRIPTNKESKVPKISLITDGSVVLDKGYYHGVYILIYFNKQDGFYRNYQQVEIEAYTYEEEMEELRLDN